MPGKYLDDGGWTNWRNVGYGVQRVLSLNQFLANASEEEVVVHLLIICTAEYGRIIQGISIIKGSNWVGRRR